MTSRSALVATLWCCALLMQSIGLLHAYVHPHGGQGARQVLACQAGTMRPPLPVACLDRPSPALTERIGDAPPAIDGLHALFAGHDSGSAGCSLFDQLTHVDLLHPLPALLPAYAAPSQPDAVHAAWHHATQATGFLARAPPAIG